MNVHTEHFMLTGPAGGIETLRDQPVEGMSPRGVAVIAHPHPLFGGTMHNKVVQTLARAFVQTGWQAVRFNFRGVGSSEGAHDNGRGELLDLLAVIQQTAPTGPLALAGFSFGASVTTHAISSLWNEDRLKKMVLVGTAASRFTPATLPPDSHMDTLILHGEQDDTVPLAAVMDWARPQVLPVTVIPAGGHFFHGQLPLLKSLVMRHLLSV